MLLLFTFVDIGHFNLFTNGVLHRDVSQGNILRYSQPVPRDALDR